MPPIPSSVPALIQRLTSLSDSNKSVLQLIHRLAKLDFQPGSVPVGADADPRVELSAEIHETLKGIEEDLELLKQEIEDVLVPGVNGNGVGSRRRHSERERDKARLAILLARIGEDLKLSHSQFRKAQLSAKRSAERAKQQERAILFSNLQSPSSSPSSSGLLPPRRSTQSSQTLTADEVIAGASSDVTAALRRTHHLMQSELSRSRFAQETLEQSTKALAELGDKYTDITSLLHNSKNLVSTLVKSQKSDTWYLETAFYILVTTIIWLVFRRWFYGPISWFVWWPLKLLYRFVALTFVSVFGIVGQKGVARFDDSTLIVKPSATGGIPKRPVVEGEPAPYVKVGLGGGRGWGIDPSPPGSISQQVGHMAEQDQQQQQGRLAEDAVTKEAEAQEEEKEQVVRGDGTVLGERDRPRNPKKRMWEENVEREKYEKEQAEKQADAATRQHLHHQKRDEL